MRSRVIDRGTFGCEAEGILKSKPSAVFAFASDTSPPGPICVPPGIRVLFRSDRELLNVRRRYSTMDLTIFLSEVYESMCEEVDGKSYGTCLFPVSLRTGREV